MQTRVSSKGQIVSPAPLRRKLGICAGDPLEVDIEAGRIVLTRRKEVRRKATTIADPVTGLPVLSAGADVPALSSRAVEAILANFP
jgi:AbrB family looped-hinge helix DNA binding protein